MRLIWYYRYIRGYGFRDRRDWRKEIYRVLIIKTTKEKNTAMNNNNHKSITAWTLVNLILYFATLGINSLGSSGFFNDMGQEDISDKYTTLITPASFTFAIWGVIYTLLLATLIYLFLKRKDDEVGKLILRISPLFLVSSILNMVWIISFSYELLGISTILIFGMLISLVLILERIYRNTEGIFYILPSLAFTLYASWVLIATIVNIALFLVQIEWDGFGISTSILTMITLLIAIIFVLFYVLRYKNAAFSISPAWGFFGIYSSYRSGSLNPPMASMIELLLLYGIGILIVVMGFTFVKNGNSIFPRRELKDKRVNRNH